MFNNAKPDASFWFNNVPMHRLNKPVDKATRPYFLEASSAAQTRCYTTVISAAADPLVAPPKQTIYHYVNNLLSLNS
jgi:hypothetical protein